jgi:hypothetical protein
MRGDDEHPDGIFSYRRPEERIPADHPLRPIRAMVDTALRELSPEFARLYPKTGRPSIAPHPERAAADRAAGLQPPLPLVRGPQHG